MALSLNADQKVKRKRYAHVIRTHARAHQLTEGELTDLLGATPAETTAIMRGDLGRLPLERMEQYAAKVTRAA